MPNEPTADGPTTAGNSESPLDATADRHTGTGDAASGDAPTPTGLATEARTPPRSGLSAITLFAIGTIVAVVGIGVALLLAPDPTDDKVIDLQQALNQQAEGGYAPADGRRAEIGKSAPNLELTFMDGSSGALAQFGGKPLVINMWSSTCAPCLKEMPAFQEVSASRPDVTFLGVNYVDTKPEAERMIAQTGVTFRQVFDPTGRVGQALGTPSLPFTVFIGSDGVVRRVHSGAMDAAQLTAEMTAAFG